MIEKIELKQVAIVGVICLTINFLFLGCGKSDTIDKLQSDTDRTMADIKTKSASTGVELGRIKTANRELKEALERAKAELDRSRAVGNSIEASLAELDRIINESRELARRNKSIINQVDTAN